MWLMRQQIRSASTRKKTWPGRRPCCAGAEAPNSRPEKAGTKDEGTRATGQSDKGNQETELIQGSTRVRDRIEKESNCQLPPSTPCPLSIVLAFPELRARIGVYENEAGAKMNS